MRSPLQTCLTPLPIHITRVSRTLIGAPSLTTVRPRPPPKDLDDFDLDPEPKEDEVPEPEDNEVDNLCDAWAVLAEGQLKIYKVALR